MTARWSPDFLDLLTALNAADARYMLVGGHAVGIGGRDDMSDQTIAVPDRRAERALEPSRPRFDHAVVVGGAT